MVSPTLSLCTKGNANMESSKKDSHGYNKSPKPKVSDRGMDNGSNVTSDRKAQGWYGNSDPYQSDNYKKAKQS